MRVLISAYACEPERGSEPGNGWNWAWHLAELGHEVWVLTRPCGQKAIEQVLVSQPMPNLHLVYVDEPTWLKRHIKGQIAIFTQYFIWQKQAYSVALQLDKECGFELVHHVTLASITGGTWLWRLNKPFVFGPVGGGHIAPSAFKKYFVGRWRIEALRSFAVTWVVPFNPSSRKTLSRADLVLVTNHDTLDLAQRLGAPRVEFFLDTSLPQDYFPQEAPTRSTSQELQVLWVGSVYARKALPLTLEALGRVSPLIPFRLTILGGGHLSKYVPSWVKEFGLEGKVEYRGRVPWREVKDAYLDNDVFLFTSLRDSFGSQLLEAMSQGLPIITLDHHGARDFVPAGAGIKVPVINPTETVNALAQAVEYMFKNPQERLQMGKIGYEFAKTQTWKQKALKMNEYYKELGLQDSKSIQNKNSSLKM